MKVIIAGGREFNDYSAVITALNELATDKGITDINEIEIISGMARGADALGVRIAKEHNLVLHEFPAQWDTYGKSAGYKRNVEMSLAATDLLAFWDGKSKGTKHMLTIAHKANLNTLLKMY